MDFENLRIKYPNFIYRNYEIIDNNDKIIINFTFEIENLTTFNPRIEILKKDFKFNDINSPVVKNIIFNLGMIESISYFKATCSPHFFIKCGKLDDFQISWFKKLFFLGLGEFRFVNNITTTKEELVNFISEGEKINFESNIESNHLSGIVIPIGGGKDSNVTLELLKKYRSDSLAFCIGSKKVSLECAKIAGFNSNQIIEINRVIDKNLIDLNSKGFFNGHTPFSAIVAFTSYLCSYLLNKKYITLSNEDSANESNVTGEKINHQYSKTIEFENDFREFTVKELQAGPEYFSMLRPISELQIAMLFSRYSAYHNVFKSCNVGSKKEPWHWCCNCPKCLFVYSILSPFLYEKNLIEIFGEDMFEKESLLTTFIELLGYGNNKPFECVGTYSEIQYAISQTIRNLKSKNKPLPYLLDYYKKHFELIDIPILTYYNSNNNLPKEFDTLLREEIIK